MYCERCGAIVASEQEGTGGSVAVATSWFSRWLAVFATIGTGIPLMPAIALVGCMKLIGRVFRLFGKLLGLSKQTA